MKLYHRTNESAAAAIVTGRSWQSKENTQEVYFSTTADGQADGYGQAVISVEVADAAAELEDEFPDGEQHFRVSVAYLNGLPVTREN